MEKIRTIRLYGSLGTKFGRQHEFVCNDTAGAIRALCSMVPGFEKELLSSRDNGIGYACFVGRENINEEALCAPVGNNDIRIAPIVIGSGRGGLFSLILGAALIGGAFLTGGVTWAGGTLVFSGGVGQLAFTLGVSMVLGGVAQLLTKPPSGITGVESVDNGASYNFNGPVNVTAQGNPVPQLYGEMYVGSVRISADLVAEDQQ